MPNALRPLLLLAALVAVVPAQAREDAAPRTMPREDAGARVRQVERDGGRVLQAEPMQRGGRQVYRLKVLTPEGRVRVLDDARGREPSRRESRFQRLPPRLQRVVVGRIDQLDLAVLADTDARARRIELAAPDAAPALDAFGAVHGGNAQPQLPQQVLP